MRSSRFLKAATGTQVSPLRHFSILNSGMMRNSHLTRHNPNHPERGFVTEAAVIGIWSLAGVATIDKMLYGSDNSHPWLSCIGLAAIISFFAVGVKSFNDKKAELLSAIFDAKASNDPNTLLNFFKGRISDDKNTLYDLFFLVNRAMETNTLETLLESAKELDPTQVKKLFDAVKKYESIERCNYFLNMAKHKGVSVIENTPSMRPGR